MTLIAEHRSTLVAGVRSRALRHVPRAAFAVDLVAVTLAGLLALVGRHRLDLFERTGSSEVYAAAEALGAAAPLMLAAWLVCITLAGGYRPWVFGAGTEEYKIVVNASLAAAGVVGVGCYLLKFPLSRGFFLLAFLVGVPALVLGRFTVRRGLHALRRRGRLLNRVVIAGSATHVEDVARVLRRESWLGYRVVGALLPAESRGSAQVPVLGTPEQLLDVVAGTHADIVFLAGGALDSSAQMRRIAWDLEGHDVQVVVAPSVSDVADDRIRVRGAGGLPLMHIDQPRTAAAGKRVFDVAGSLLLLTLLSPLMLVAAVWVRRHDGGPVLFRQTRTGLDGRTFPCLKFRSMVVDAEERLATLHAATGYDGGLFKLADDPRVTPPGRWLRRYSIDELPQLVNVLRGEMSLVGPRPPLPSEVAAYSDDNHRRLRVRPGLTGLWQVSGRSDLPTAEAMRLDLYYVDNWSMLRDLTILGRTAGAVVRSRGAY